MVQVVDVENRPMQVPTINRPKYAEVKHTPEARGGIEGAEEPKRRGKKRRGSKGK